LPATTHTYYNVFVNSQAFPRKPMHAPK